MKIIKTNVKNITPKIKKSGRSPSYFLWHLITDFFFIKYTQKPDEVLWIFNVFLQRTF